MGDTRSLLHISLRRRGLNAQREVQMLVRFNGEIVGNYRADLIVENKVIVETKTVSGIAPIHELQLFNYLKATGLQVGLILNFGPKATFERYAVNSKQRNPRNPPKPA